uniref:Clr5 domain-containing protein n=1 Tax=Panagrellus redivivus TaxID=6233 RepID=A0A7E4VDR0_PANRE
MLPPHLFKAWRAKGRRPDYRRPRRLNMFSWDNDDVKDMIDRYVKATYLPHLGVKTRPHEASAAEIAAVLKSRYGVNHSRHAVRHQFEKHRRNIAGNITTPTVSHKQKKMEADASPAPFSHYLPMQESSVSPVQPQQQMAESLADKREHKKLEIRQFLELLVSRPNNIEYIPRSEHFIAAGDYTYKVDPQLLAYHSAENFNYQGIDDIDPADILPFTPR